MALALFSNRSVRIEATSCVKSPDVFSSWQIPHQVGTNAGRPGAETSGRAIAGSGTAQPPGKTPASGRQSPDDRRGNSKRRAKKKKPETVRNCNEFGTATDPQGSQSIQK
jgi:hypothetical protein